VVRRGQVWSLVRGPSCTSDDPLPGGSVSIPSVVQILDRTTLKDNLGYVAPGTMNAVEDAMREFLELG
jgi:mRNA interferase MazF